MALSIMSGPKKIIDLDPSTDVLKKGVAYNFNGKIWHTEPVGCIQCIDEFEQDEEATEKPRRTISYEDSDGTENFLCMKHGECEAVKYSIVKKYTICIADYKREDEVRLDDTMLFPLSMSAADREILIVKMLDEQEEEEQNESVIPSDDE